jgi:hypothetical protein
VLRIMQSTCIVGPENANYYHHQKVFPNCLPTEPHPAILANWERDWDDHDSRPEQTKSL